MKTYILDQKKSRITWKGENSEMHPTGDLRFSGGKLFTELGNLVEGFLGIDFDSLRVSHDTALTEDQRNEFVEQLKSKDFLDTRNFPNAEYKIIDIVNEAGETKMKGILSLKDVAFGLNFPIDLHIKDKQITAEGDFKLQHVNHEMTEIVNDKIEGDAMKDIELKFKLVAEAQAL